MPPYHGQISFWSFPSNSYSFLHDKIWSEKPVFEATSDNRLGPIISCFFFVKKHHDMTMNVYHLPISNMIHEVVLFKAFPITLSDLVNNSEDGSGSLTKSFSTPATKLFTVFTPTEPCLEVRHFHLNIIGKLKAHPM